MQIKEIYLRKYGPLKFKKELKLSQFNLIFGKNEEGKTLTLEALLKLLLGKKQTKRLNEINRVEEFPEGYLILEDSQKREWKFPEKGNISQLMGLKSFECQNLFVIRNSQLSIAREFLTDLTAHLVGLQRDKFKKIKEKLLEIGRLNSQGEFRNIKEEKLRERFEKAKELIDEIEDFLEKIKKRKIENLEEKLVKLQKEKEKIKWELKQLEKAKKRKEYERANCLLTKLEKIEPQLKFLEKYNQKDFLSWKISQREISEIEKKLIDIQREIKERENELKTEKEKLSQKERIFFDLEQKKKILSEKIDQNEINLAKEKLLQIAEREQKSKFLNLVFIFSFFAFIFSQISLILFQKLLLFYFLASLFLILALISGFLIFQFESQKGWLKKILQKNKLIFSKIGIEINSIKEIFSVLDKINKDYESEKREKEKLELAKNTLIHDIERLKKELKRERERMEKEKEKIEKIERESGEISLESYFKKLEKKNELEREREKIEGILKEDFGENFKEKIKKLEFYKNEAKNIDYDEKKENVLKEKEEKIEKEIEDENEKLKEIEKDTNEIAIKACQILRKEVLCQNISDLKKLKRELEEFVKEKEKIKENILIAKEIFDKIESEEKEKLSKIFGPQSLVSKFFSQITNNLYTQVIFDFEKEEIKIKQKNGKELLPRHLSGGAYDQLYFSIRLGLSEKFLNKEKGFFILDDPFIKADMERCFKQMEILKRLVFEFGWQIIFLSAKEEIKAILKEDIEKNKIQYIEIPKIVA